MLSRAGDNTINRRQSVQCARKECPLERKNGRKARETLVREVASKRKKGGVEGGERGGEGGVAA